MSDNDIKISPELQQEITLVIHSSTTSLIMDSSFAVEIQMWIQYNTSRQYFNLSPITFGETYPSTLYFNNDGTLTVHFTQSK